MPVGSVLLWIPLGVLLGMLGANLGARLCFARAPSTFRCKLRLPGDPDQPLAPWRWHRTRARWIHDVLLVQRGLLLPRTATLCARGPDRAVRRTSPIEVNRLGADPMVLTLTLDDSRVLEIAARAADVTTLAGPFLTAAIPGLPPAPTEPRPYGR
jgi:hypothetical protein